MTTTAMATTTMAPSATPGPEPAVEAATATRPAKRRPEIGRAVGRVGGHAAWAGCAGTRQQRSGEEQEGETTAEDEGHGTGPS
jgi:hypothetical protein